MVSGRIVPEDTQNSISTENHSNKHSEDFEESRIIQSEVLS